MCKENDKYAFFKFQNKHALLFQNKQSRSYRRITEA